MHNNDDDYNYDECICILQNRRSSGAQNFLHRPILCYYPSVSGYCTVRIFVCVRPYFLDRRRAYAMALCPSVRLSVRVSRTAVLSKRLKYHPQSSTPYVSLESLVFWYQRSRRDSNGLPSTGANVPGWGKIVTFDK